MKQSSLGRPSFELVENESNSSQLANVQQAGSSYLDWPCKIDLKKNGERTVQTKPILIDERQYWAFIIDLGNVE